MNGILASCGGRVDGEAEPLWVTLTADDVVAISQMAFLSWVVASVDYMAGE